MAEHKTCPKCGGRMGEGHLIDMGHGSVTAARWQPGPAERRWHGSIKVRKKELRDVASFACERCGLVENYLKKAGG